MTTSDDDERWLDTLGPLSPALRDIVADAVLDGDWMVWSREPHCVTLRRYDEGVPAAYDEISVWRTNGRFTTANRYRCCPVDRTRRLDELKGWTR